MSKQCLHFLKSRRKLSTVDLSTGCFEAVLSYYTHEAAAHANFMDLDRLCSITISDIAVRQKSLRPPGPSLPFPYFFGDHSYNNTSLHPKLPRTDPPARLTERLLLLPR